MPSKDFIDIRAIALHHCFQIATNKLRPHSHFEQNKSKNKAKINCILKEER